MVKKADPRDPATWTLPVESYMPTASQAQTITRARAKAIAKCVNEAGFPQWTPPPALPPLGGKTLTDWRYGIHDKKLAGRRGYHPDAAEQKAYNTAMEVGAVDRTGTDDGVKRRCASLAEAKVPTAQLLGSYAETLGNNAFRKATASPQVKEVFAKWSSCMKAKGYSYKEPMDANDDPRFNDPDTVTRREIATALADIECRDTYNVAKVWFDAEAAQQRPAIAQHKQRLDSDRNATSQAVADSRAVLATR
ncbi:hypothetical protein [Streptomyces sp. NPDC093225]|uniref:hypothetical protein n=1 Tax=Streptomyces sp. NPDC093225 TaxID=3366034 RepID=UPI00380A5C1D